MNAFRPLSLALALVLGTGASLARADDLIQIYGEARASDPQLAGAEATNQANSESVDQARSALLPQIGASLAYSQSHGSSGGPQFVTNEDGSQSLVNVTSSADNYSRTLSGRLDQSILDLSKWTALKSARATVKSSDATYEAAQQDLLIRVATAYFDVLTAEDALRFAQANEQALNRQMEQAQQRFDVGLSAITDVNDAKAQHDTAVASVITAQNTLDDNNEALRQLTNKEPGELKKLRDKLPLDKPNPENPESWVAVAVEQNPVLSSYAYSLEAANANIQTARSGHLPTINGQVLYSEESSLERHQRVELQRCLPHQQRELVDFGRPDPQRADFFRRLHAIARAPVDLHPRCRAGPVRTAEAPDRTQHAQQLSRRDCRSKPG